MSGICSREAEMLIEAAKSRKLTNDEKTILYHEAFRLLNRVNELLDEIHQRCLKRAEELCYPTLVFPVTNKQ